MFVGKRGRLKRGVYGFEGDKVKTMKSNVDYDSLWEETAGDPMCPKCYSMRVLGHIREVSVDVAVVDWHCRGCHHSWSASHPFENGSLEVDDLEVKVMVRPFPCSDPKCFFDRSHPCVQVAFDVKPEFRSQVDFESEEVVLPPDWLVEVPFTSDMCEDCSRFPVGLRFVP